MNDHGPVSPTTDVPPGAPLPPPEADDERFTDDMPAGAPPGSDLDDPEDDDW